MKEYKDLMVGDIVKIECGDSTCIGEIFELERNAKNFVLIKTTSNICRKITIPNYTCFIDCDEKILPLTKEDRLMVLKYKMCGVGRENGR